MQRRYAGKTPIQFDEVDAIESVTGIDAEYLITGVKREMPPTGGGIRSGLHPESNRRPSHYKRNSSSNVVDFRPADQTEQFATAI
jgi:hypothetical protein